METNPLISAFATALVLVFATSGCATSLEPAQPHVPAAYVLPPPPEEGAAPADAGAGARPAVPVVIHARAFGERQGSSEPTPVVHVPFLAPDTRHAGAEACRLVAIPDEPTPPAPERASDRGAGDGVLTGALASGAPRGASSSTARSQPPTVTVTGFRGRAPVDIAWAFPVPPPRNGAPPRPAPTGKTLVQMALFDAMPSPDAKPRSVLQCTSEIDSIAWAVPRTMVDQLLGSAPSAGAVVRVSVARAPSKPAETAKGNPAPRLAVGAFVDLPVERDAALNRR